MKINKSLVAMLALGGLVAFGSFAKAQEQTNTPPAGEHKRGPGGGGPGGLDPKARLDKIAQDLGLSEDQKTKLGELLKEEMPKMKALREDQSLSKEDKMAKVKEIRSETSDKVKGILTPEQFEKWTKMREQMGRRGGPGGPKGEGKPPGEKPEGAPEKKD